MDITNPVKYFLTILITFFSSQFLLRRIIKTAIKFKILDIPSKRRIHIKPIPRIGGLGIYISSFIGLFFLWIIDFFFSYGDSNQGLFFHEAQFILVFIFSTLFFLIGILDDLFSLSAFLRLNLQFLVAILIWLFGFKIEAININLSLINFQINFPTIISLVITIVWIVGIVNAINWIDGCDGLAIGLNIIVCLNFIIYSYIIKRFDYFSYLIPILISSIGFYRFNKFPSKIIMGDGGSYFIGCTLGLLSLILFKDNFVLSENSKNFDIIVVLIILMVPIFDMINVISKRIIKNSSPFLPDNSHLHHKLLTNGFNQSETTNIISFLILITNICALIIKLNL